LLERVTSGGCQAAAHRERPRHLAHVDVAARVDGEAMRRSEAAGGAGVGRAPAREHSSVLVEHADAAVAWLGEGPVPLRRLSAGPPELRDVRAALRVEHEVGRTLGVGPLREVLAVRTEDLDAIILAIAHEDPAVGRGGDAVGQVELARAFARDAPGLLQLPTRREGRDAAVAVAVRDVQITLRPDGQVRGAIEGTGRPRNVDRVLAVV